MSLGGVTVSVLGGTHAPVYGDVPDCPNLAYLLDDGALLHPGDSFFVPDRPVQTLAVAIDGPWLKLSEAVDYVKAVRPETVLPIHEGELTDVAKYVGMLAFSGITCTSTRLVGQGPGESSPNRRRRSLQGGGPRRICRLLSTDRLQETSFHRHARREHTLVATEGTIAACPTSPSRSVAVAPARAGGG